MFHGSCFVSRGTTLVELLVYVAIMAVLSVLIINSLITMFKSFSETRSNRDLLESGTLVMERMSREIRGANSADAGVSVFGSSPGTLKLNTTDSGGAAKTVQFSVSSGALQFTDNGTLSGNLTAANISVSSLIFNQITTAHGTAVKVSVTLTDTRSTNSRSANFYDTVIMRGAY